MVVVDHKHPRVGAQSVGTYVWTWHISIIRPKSMVRLFALPSCRLHCTAVYTTMIRLHYPNYNFVDYEGFAWTLTTWDGPYLWTCQEILYPLVGLVYSSKRTNELESHWQPEAMAVWFFRQVRVLESFNLLAQFEGHLEFEFQAFQHTHLSKFFY